MEARKEEKIESKGKRFGWRIAISYSINVILWISYKIFVFRSEKNDEKRERAKEWSGDVAFSVVTAKKRRRKK